MAQEEKGRIDMSNHWLQIASIVQKCTAAKVFQPRTFSSPSFLLEQIVSIISPFWISHRMTVLTDPQKILLSSPTLACRPIPQQQLRILAPWWRHPVGHWWLQRSWGLQNNLKTWKWIMVQRGCTMVPTTHVLKRKWRMWRWRMVMVTQGCHNPLWSKILGRWWLRFCRMQRLGVWLQSLVHPPKMREFLTMSPYSHIMKIFHVFAQREVLMFLRCPELVPLFSNSLSVLVCRFTS